MVLDEYEAHLPLTARQIFYRLVGRYAYDKTEAAYQKLCNHLCNARRAGLIPFHAIRDDGITTLSAGHYDDEDQFRRTLR